MGPSDQILWGLLFAFQIFVLLTIAGQLRRLRKQQERQHEEQIAALSAQRRALIAVGARIEDVIDEAAEVLAQVRVP